MIKSFPATLFFSSVILCDILGKRLLLRALALGRFGIWKLNYYFAWQQEVHLTLKLNSLDFIQLLQTRKCNLSDQLRMVTWSVSTVN